MHGSHHSVTPLDCFVVFSFLMCSVWASVSPLISSLDSPVTEPGFSQGFFLHSVTDGVLVSPSWELRTASPRGRYGERRQVDLCLKHTHICAYTYSDVIGDSLWRHYRRDHSIRGAGRIHHPLLSSSLTALFEACNLVRVQFSLYYHGEH